MTSAVASSFVLGRSNFDQIAPGTVVPFQVDGSFGRIQSVQLKNMCLDVEPEQPYPVDRDCNPIEVTPDCLLLWRPDKGFFLGIISEISFNFFHRHLTLNIFDRKYRKYPQDICLAAFATWFMFLPVCELMEDTITKIKKNLEL